MKFGVVVFPGSNCDKDMLHIIEKVLGKEAILLWHKDTDLSMFSKEDCIFLPGGFSYGDYLRTGALAKFSPIMKAVKEFADKGGYIWGICNGFQILCEAGLLPGAILSNTNQKYICKNIYLKANDNDNPVTQSLDTKKAYKIPIAHGEGRYYADDNTLKTLQANKQILFSYCDEQGKVLDTVNPNGSLLNIAGICNKEKNIFGMMPHPERASEEILGNVDGKSFFDSFINSSLN